MTDVINKVLGVILAFVLLVGAPMVITTKEHDLAAERGIHNEVTNFIDKVTDNGRISELDLSNFYLGIASYGLSMDTKIKRYVKVVNPDGNGGTYTSYTPSDDLGKWNKGDIIQIQTTALDYTPGQRMSYRLMHLTPPVFQFTQAGMVRN